MNQILPSTLHEANDPRLSELAATLIGERLFARYMMPSNASWDYKSDLEYVHEVDMGVQLVSESGLALELSWATPGREEGLSITLDAVENYPSTRFVDVLDVSECQEWAHILGRRIEILAISFHVHADDSSVRPWSFRIGVMGGLWVTVALGEIVNCSLVLMPTVSASTWGVV